jgi:hypothetical protein
LLAGPGTDAALPRTRLEIGIAFRGGRSDDPTLDTDLTIQVIPMHDDGDTRVCFNLKTLARVVVRKKTDIARVDHDFFA